MLEPLIELSKEEIELSFAASCIEGVARKLGKSYKEIYERMNKIGMLENYILPYYDVLHTQSREYVTEDMIECLTNWEKEKK